MTAGALPRYATCWMLMPAAAMKISPVRWPGVPAPAEP